MHSSTIQQLAGGLSVLRDTSKLVGGSCNQQEQTTAVVGLARIWLGTIRSENKRSGGTSGNSRRDRGKGQSLGPGPLPPEATNQVRAKGTEHLPTLNSVCSSVTDL